MSERQGDDMFQGRKTAPRADDLARIEALVRDRYEVGEEDIVLVSEEPGRLPGLPQRVTTILFWRGRDRRHRLRIFKPADGVRREDLPERWLRSALLDEGEGDCC